MKTSILTNQDIRIAKHIRDSLAVDGIKVSEETLLKAILEAKKEDAKPREKEVSGAGNPS
jgi:hypothetical protein